jgi:rifampicin phosphotransferase
VRTSRSMTNEGCLVGTGLLEDAPALAPLDHPCALDPELAGNKAAALARSSRLGLPVLPGAVLTTVAPATALLAGGAPAALRIALLDTADALAGSGGRLVVRSSSPLEDSTTSARAGAFTSVLDVAPADVLDAVAQVLRSGGGDPMAVLLQPMLDARLGGVLFGLDPVTGRRDRLVVESVEGGPADLVSGRVTAARAVLTTRGRLVEASGPEGRLDRHTRRALASLAANAARALGTGPQDIEWAVDRDRRTWLLQSRPVTAAARAVGRGPLLGPGPLAETLPGPLSPLEADLWVEPLREAVIGAVEAVGVVPGAALRSSPVVALVGGRPAADLELLGVAPGRRGLLAVLDPRPPAHRLVAAWRVGRLRRALPLLARSITEQVDAELAAVPDLGGLSDDELARLLARTGVALRSVHGHEVLAGLLEPGAAGGATGAAAALAALARGRAAGLDDDDLVARSPEVLALVPPALDGPGPLPATPSIYTDVTVDDLGPREALRLRSRWLQELGGRAAVELGRRATAAGLDPTTVPLLTVDELVAVVRGAPVPADVMTRAVVAGPPLPAAFRLTDDGTPVPQRVPGSAPGAGQGAGGGRGAGTVVGLDGGSPPAGSVLVVANLEPALAAVLPGLAGLVAETGSVLSHLAITARELGVPTVVGVPDALVRFPPGTAVVVDGTTGAVEVQS